MIDADDARDEHQSRLLASYKQVSNLAQCAREFGIGRRQVKAILERNGIQIHGPKEAAADEQAVLRAYDRTGSIAAIEPAPAQIFTRRDHPQERLAGQVG